MSDYIVRATAADANIRAFAVTSCGGFFCFRPDTAISQIKISEIKGGTLWHFLQARLIL